MLSQPDDDDDFYDPDDGYEPDPPDPSDQAEQAEQAASQPFIGHYCWGRSINPPAEPQLASRENPHA